jgi:hypothetical protein
MFDDVDREVLLSQPAGGFVDDLASAALAFMNVDEDDVAKNSKGTASA